MSVYKMVEIVGTSGTSVSDAVRAAVERASETLDDLSWFEVKEIRGRIAEGEIAEYQVKVDIGFLVHSTKRASREGARAGSRQARSVAAQNAAKAGERRRADLARGFPEQPSRGGRRDA